MKVWSSDHPKAALMARKRIDILQAARAQFLETGYDGTSMESIAKAANVSIMTLYRHAETKDALFAAVIASACEPETAEEEEELRKILSLPLSDALLQSALHMQDGLSNAATITLMRVVIGEVGRFPHLAELAYQGFILRLELLSAEILSLLPETSTLNVRVRRTLGRAFVDRLVGATLIRALLGLSADNVREKRRRAELAKNEVLSALRQIAIK